MLRKATEIKSSQVGRFCYADKEDKGLQIANLVRLLKDQSKTISGSNGVDNSKESLESANQTGSLEPNITANVKEEMEQHQMIKENVTQSVSTMNHAPTQASDAEITKGTMKCKSTNEESTNPRSKKCVSLGRDQLYLIVIAISISDFKN